MKRRAVAYLRVSTTDQAENGYGLEVQRAAVRAYAQNHDLRIVAVHVDDISGSNGLESRIGLARALHEIEEGRAAVLLVPRLDRLARDLLIQETVLAKVRQMGAETVSVAEPDIDSEEPTRVLVRQVLGAIAQWERMVIRGRTLAGKAQKIAAGGYGGGRPAYGRAAVGGELVDEPAEQATVRRIVELREQGLSLRQIAARLAAEGRPAKSGGRWHPKTISTVLRRATASKRPSPAPAGAGR